MVGNIMYKTTLFHSTRWEEVATRAKCMYICGIVLAFTIGRAVNEKKLGMGI